MLTCVPVGDNVEGAFGAGSGQGALKGQHSGDGVPAFLQGRVRPGLGLQEHGVHVVVITNDRVNGIIGYPVVRTDLENREV